MVETSIIIRTKNEEKWVGECLRRIYNQTYKNFEVVVIDSGSTDRTLEIVRKYPIKLVQIKPEEFNFPYAINIGCRNASAQKYFVIISAHSLPISETWLEDGMRDFDRFKNEKVMGVYGWMKALPDASIWEKIYFNIISWGFLGLILKELAIVRKSRMGVLGFTHAIIRKDLWEKHHLDEAYGLGGEDSEWVRYWIKRGYVAIRDKKFTVFHSHGLGLIAFIKQYRYWFSIISKPQSFRELKYRNK